MTTISTTTPTTVSTTTVPQSNQFNCSFGSGGTYNVVLGSNIIGSSTLPFQVTVNSNKVSDGDADDVYVARLVLVGSPNRVVNQTSGTQVGKTAVITNSYTFSTVGTYSFYISVTDSQGVTVNTSVDTVHALQGLTATASMSNNAPKQGQADSINLNATDNYRALPDSGEGFIYYMDYRVVQTAPNGTVSNVAFNAPSNQYGQGYFGGYNIILPQFTQSGTYGYKVYLYDWIGGLNATATASVFVTAVAVTANTLSLNIPEQQHPRRPERDCHRCSWRTGHSHILCLDGQWQHNSTDREHNNIQWKLIDSGHRPAGCDGQLPRRPEDNHPGTITVSAQPNTTTTTTIAPSTGGGGCGLCGGGSFTGGLPPSTVTTTVIPTTTVAPSHDNTEGTAQYHNADHIQPVRDASVDNHNGRQTTPGSGLTPPTLTTMLFLVIIALLLVILALILLIGKKGGSDAALEAEDAATGTAVGGGVMAAGKPKKAAEKEDEDEES